ncbi:MAG: DUF6883 domain-containing protein [Pirellulales bacterium]
MKLPNGHQAIVELEKLVDYCLNVDHPRGKHKAKVFKASCGLTAEHAEWMRDQLLQAAANDDASSGKQYAFGQRYVIECNLEGPVGKARVVTAWIVRDGEDFPRFVSAYVK